MAKIEGVRLAGRNGLKLFADAGVEMGYGSDLLVVDDNPLDSIDCLVG